MVAIHKNEANAYELLISCEICITVVDILHVSCVCIFVFSQILIRNRATELDARMNDGTTPLILAARLAVEGMVEELIHCHADINAVDDHGQRAFHIFTLPVECLIFVMEVWCMNHSMSCTYLFGLQ